MKREAEKALKIEQREAQHAEYEKKKAEYERKKAAWIERQSTRAELSIKKSAADRSAPREARVAKDWDARSDISLASTAVSAACTLTCEQELEVQAEVAKDKAVRRFEKLLREIAKLEQSAELDVLQQNKVDRKSELEVELETARGIAAAHARNHVRQSAHLDKMD